MSIDDVVSRMEKFRIRDRTSSSQRLAAAHHRDVNMEFDIYTPSVHGTIEQFLTLCNVKKMMDQEFITESAEFRHQYDEWKAKQDEKQSQIPTSSNDNKKTSTSMSTSADASTSTSSTSTSTSTSTSAATSPVKGSTSPSTEIHVRTVKYQRIYQRSAILNASVLDNMAHQYHCTSGRWMLFLTSDQDVTGIWKRLVKACDEGALGPHIEISRSSAQASVVVPKGEHWKLAIWTWDYTDIHDCERVLKEIKKFMPNVNINAKTCSYKSKITSFLEILSRNEWNLPYKMHEHLLSQPPSRRRY